MFISSGLHGLLYYWWQSKDNHLDDYSLLAALFNLKSNLALLEDLDENDGIVDDPQLPLRVA